MIKTGDYSELRIAFQKYGPFGLHFVLTLLVSALCLLVLDGRSFNTTSYRPQYTEVDGSTSHVSSYLPLQSDITTAVSLAATVTRVAGGWWAAGYLWRCIFVSMERDGISVEGLSRVASYRPPFSNFTRRSNMVIIYITLFATFATDYFSSVLTGSLVWENAEKLIPGSVPLTEIRRGVNGVDMTNYFLFTDEQTTMVAVGSASANLAWGALQPNTISNITEPATTFRRIIKGARYLPANSTMANVTIPYLIVDAFEWIRDSDSILTEQQIALVSEWNNSFNPYFSVEGIGGLLPDSQWGPPNTTLLGDPQIVSETRLFVFAVGFWDTEPCLQNFTIDPGSQINLYQYQYSSNGGVYFDCFAIANVTYQAGVATCQNCTLVSPTVVEAQAPLSLLPDSFTPMALGFAPSLGTNLLFSNYSVPQNYGTRRNFAIELTSRAYQAAWAAYSDGYGNQAESTTVEISLPTLRAKFIRWRVYFWVALHLSVLVLGLLFVYVQSRCQHPWVDDPYMAVFWLDTDAVPTGTGVDPWQPGKKIPNDGMLILDNAGERSRSVIIKRGSR